MLPILETASQAAGPRDRRSCLRCETLPAVANVGGDLHCWFPTAHVAHKMRAVLSALGLSSVATPAGGVAFAIPSQAIDTVTTACREHLSEVERDDTRTLVTEPGVLPTADDLARVEPMARWLARVGSTWLIDMLHDQRLTSYFQPIVRAASPETVYGHEALLRGIAEDGCLVPPQRLFQAAREAGLTFQLDLAARRSAIAAARAHQLRGTLFVNFAPTAIYDPASCLRSTVAAVDQAGIARSDVVFEIVETERAHDPRHLRNILDYYRGAGFRVALDDVGAGYSSLNLIHELRPDLLKLDMELLRNVDSDAYKARIVANLLEVATALGIDTLAEGIESEGERDFAVQHGATYLQGYLFARPAAVPVTVTASARARSVVEC